MDVEVWLKGLGLAQYAGLFRENEIDSEVLPELTDQNLRDIGVPLGHRLKMLRAIRALGEAPPAAAASPETRGPPSDAAERRQLTVMFCDLVGSTAMSARLDPEDMRAIVGAYHRCCASLIERHGGFVAKYMGDGVLAYFGYPEAHEHDAERAVQAGLAIVEAAPRLETAAGAPLSVRVGIATGIVVVGDLLGSGESRERGVVGDTPNLAARLQGIAQPGAVVIAEGTRRLLGSLFELKDLGAHDLKGIAAPTRAWAALRASATESRFEALHAERLTALVGREEEVELLLRRWAKAKAGEGQAALLTGEAGIGKSRLTASLIERVGDEPHARLRYFCSPRHADSALYPIASQMERAAGIERSEAAGANLDRLEVLLAQGSATREEAGLIAEMLSLPNDGRFPVVDLTPPQRRRGTLEALIAQFTGLAKRGPLLMIFEDAHWADATSLELLGRLVDAAQALPALIFVTTRPEFSPNWIGRANVTSLNVNRLAPREVAALIDRVAGNKALPERLRRDIIERADGIPLFVEEMTKAVLEAEGEADAARTAAAIPATALGVPASLYASLMARLDRLGAASREVAQTGAAIGREFSHGLLLAASRGPEATTSEALDRLVDAGLLLKRGSAPTAEYQFKHALIQDTAYSTLLRDARGALHARIAAAILAEAPETAAHAPETLAHHLSQAGEFDKAASYWLDAGQRAARQSANAEAIAHLRRGIEGQSGLTPTKERERLELALRLAFGPAVLATQGFGSAEAKVSYGRAAELADRLGDDRARFAATWGLWITGQGDIVVSDVQRGRLSQMIAIAEAVGDFGLMLQAHHSAWATWSMSGDFVRSLAHVKQGLPLYDFEKHRHHALMYGGHDPGVCGTGQKAMNAWVLGFADQAAAAAAEGLALADRLQHMPSVLHALWLAGNFYCLSRDFEAGLNCGARLRSMGIEHDLALYQSVGGIVHGWASANMSDGADGRAELKRSLELYMASTRFYNAMYRAALIESLIAAGDVQQASEEFKRTETADAVLWRAELARLRGKLLRRGEAPDLSAAERSYREAIAIAQSQQARMLELRASVALARLWRDQDRRAEALGLLAPVYGWFTEGFATPDLTDARVLLEELSNA